MVELTELINAPHLLPELKKLLAEYGNYMYDELGLVAGREAFNKQLEHLPGKEYEPPHGTFILATYSHQVAGCVAIKKFAEQQCEMKRMYTRLAFRNKGIGMQLTKYVISWCNKLGYKKILLDTNLEMKEAVLLYQKCGFKEIASYCINENDHPVFMEYIL